MPLFQVALDLWDENEAFELVRRLEDYVDILEVGTPLLLSCGLSFVERLRKVTSKPLFVDAKIVDAGEEEAQRVFEKGADIVSVLGGASRVTLEGVQRVAQRLGKRWVVDTIDLLPTSPNVALLEVMRPDFLALHVPHDVVFASQAAWEHMPFPEKILRNLPLMVAGGLTPEILPRVLERFRPAVVVVGSALTRSPFPEKVAQAVRRVLDAFS